MLDLIPSLALKHARDVSDETQSHSRHIYEKKMRAGDAAVTQQIGEGKDIMSRLSSFG